MVKTSTYSDGQSVTQSTQKCKLRYPTQSDDIQVLELCKLACDNMKWVYNELDLYDSVKLCIEKTISIVAEIDGELVGLISVISMPSFYNKNVVQGQQLLWYVKKDYRKLGVGIELLKTVEQVCKDKGINELYMPAPANKEELGFIKYYDSNNYTKKETMYLKVL